MLLSSKTVPISASGDYYWEDESSVVDVDTRTAYELLSIPGSDFFCPEPEEAKAPAKPKAEKKEETKEPESHPLRDGGDGDLGEALNVASPTKRRSTPKE